MELYNKYRPDSSEKILGNDLAIKSLKSEIANGGHCFLITGASGCGKTTLARAAALDMGCDDMTIHEVDASDDRGIDAMRKIKEQMRYVPINGGKEVFILDECHGITSAAQESVLKMLEECPEHVYIFLCTTNPEKLIKTIQTRCSRIEMKPLDGTAMLGLLRRVAHWEKANVGLEVLQQIVSLSNGSSRDALKKLGQVLYLESDEERSKFLMENVFSDEKAEVIDLCRALLKQEGWAKYMDCLDKLKDDLSSNSEGIRQAIMGYANAVLKKGINPAAVGMIQVFSNVDCFRNGKFGIMVGLLDFQDYMQG